MFDLIAVISLARRPDRLAGFRQRLGAAWPDGLSRLEVVPAVDGERCPKPDWFQGPPGAWGCYRSHQRLVEDCLLRGVETAVIFEDDATFVPDFPARLEAFLAALPADWGQAYLGGQHLQRAVPVTDDIVRGINVNRTHAYALHGRRMGELYQHLHAGEHWKGRHHVDHHFGRIHGREWPAYAPRTWLCGQAEGTSDIRPGVEKERWWAR